MGILKLIFIILLLILFPLGEVARLSFNEIAVTLTDIGIGLVSIIWISFNIYKKRTIRAELFFPILIFIGAAFLSLLVNLGNVTIYESIVSSLYLVRWVAYSLIYFIVLDLDKSFLKKIPTFLLAAGGLILVGGFAQYFLYPDLRNLYYLGWDEHLYRMFSSFLDPNFLGAFFVLYLLFVIGLIFNSDNLDKIKLLAILAIVTLVGIFLTFSRSAYLMLFVSVFTFLILKRKLKWILTFAIVLVLSIFLLSKNVPQTEGTNLLRTASAESKIESIIKALTIFKGSPIFGVGFNAYRYAQRDYGFVNEEKQLIHSAAGTDNSFLFILTTTGIIGFISFLFLIYKIINLSLTKSSFSPVLFSSVVGLLINSLFINSLFYIFIMLWIWILIGLTESS